jgi:hypothetical protein
VKARLKSEQVALVTVREKMSKAGKQMFQLYANLLDDDARSVFDKIVEDRTESEQWTDIYGKEQSGKTGKTYVAYTGLPVIPSPNGIQARCSRDSTEIHS